VLDLHELPLRGRFDVDARPLERAQQLGRGVEARLGLGERRAHLVGQREHLRRLRAAGGARAQLLAQQAVVLGGVPGHTG
jgi:hypothetical protein